ncbi:MAG: TolC family protein [Ramlibacter sp.]
MGRAQAQSIAVARSQQLAAYDAGFRAAREMAVAAGQLPDPVLKVGIDNLPVNGPDRFSLSRDFMTMRRIGLMQELTGRDKRDLKVERALQDAGRIEAERALAAANVRKETALAWLERYYGELVLDLLHEQAHEVRLQILGAEVSYRNGRGSQADVFAARAAMAGLDDRMQQAERQVRSGRIMLARWIGGAEASRPLDVPGLDEAAPQWQLHDAVRHPQIAVLQAQLRAAETEVKQAGANTRPDWTVEAAYQQRGGAYSNMVSIGLSVPLQLDRANRQDREVAAKLAAKEQARARLEDAVAAHEGEVAVASNDWQSGSRRAARLRAELLPASALRVQAVLTAYRSGKADLASVLTARRDEIDARIQLLTLEGDTARLGAQLDYLTATTQRSEQP